MREKERAQRILQILSKEFGVPEISSSRSGAFQALVRTVLSQATNDRNRDRAYANLTKKYRIEPEALAKADVKKNKYTVQLIADDKRVEKKDKNTNEPVQFYVTGSRQPLELVVNEVAKDQITGYLSVPKVAQARN